MFSFFIQQKFVKLTAIRVLMSLSNVSFSKCSFICRQLGIFSTTRWYLLTFKQLHAIASWVEQAFFGKASVGFDFKAQQSKHLFFLKKLKDYKHFRLLNGLPCHGQNTHSNGQMARKTNRSLICALKTSGLALIFSLFLESQVGFSSH